jgi:serine/threonine protein kinase
LYIAPEMLEHNLSGKFTDLWALGCIIYQMLVGQSPFYAKTKNEVFQNVIERKISFPHYMDKDAKDLIEKLLDLTPDNRLGMKDY